LTNSISASESHWWDFTTDDWQHEDRYFSLCVFSEGSVVHEQGAQLLNTLCPKVGAAKAVLYQNPTALKVFNGYYGNLKSKISRNTKIFLDSSGETESDPEEKKKMMDSLRSYISSFPWNEVIFLSSKQLKLVILQNK